MNNNLLKLPQKPSLATLKLLTRAKLLLEHALSHASSPSGIDPLVAIHGLDNSIEFTLRIIADHIDFEKITGKTFPESELAQMAGEINRVLRDCASSGLPYYSEIKVLRQVRNLVQHGGIDPGSDLNRFVKITNNFFERIISLVFGLTPNELEISELVTNKVVKDFLRKSEKHLKENKFLDSIVAARDAFDNALYLKRRNMRRRVDAVPAIAELDKSKVYMQWFFDEIAENIEGLKLGLNSTLFERFKEIIDHIPSSHRSDDRGHTVMQRGWEKKDAQFCYSFTSNNIIRWQAEELEPLYKISLGDEERNFEESINGINITPDSENSGCIYAGEKGSEIILQFVDTKTKIGIDTLETGKDYDWKDIHRINGELNLIIESKVLLKYKRCSIATHNPIRWELVLGFERVPFTWWRRDYKNGKLKEESPSINKSSANKLITLYGVDEKLAKKVVSYRKAVGKILKKEDLWNIEGINEEQVWWLSYFTRI
ncbi:MAG: helix-hairpin-helix domain-containing protein [Desulfurivibrionaceae bacterium]|jgi:hypothetical protein